MATTEATIIAPGVTARHEPTTRHFTGTREALIEAGIARRSWFPASGERSKRITIENHIGKVRARVCQPDRQSDTFEIVYHVRPNTSDRTALIYWQFTWRLYKSEDRKPASSVACVQPGRGSAPYGILRQHAYRITVPAGSRHHSDIVIQTQAFDVNDARHLTLCMLGMRASEEAEIVEIRLGVQAS